MGKNIILWISGLDCWGELNRQRYLQTPRRQRPLCLFGLLNQNRLSFYFIKLFLMDGGQVHYLGHCSVFNCFFFLRESFNLWRPLLIIVFYYQTKTLISFLCRWELNSKSLIQPSETLPTKLTGTYYSIVFHG